MCPRCGKKIEMCHCKNPIFGTTYREGVLMRLVEDYKYKSIRATSAILAELMLEAIPRLERMCQSDSVRPRDVVVVPLPTISRHIRERGFDHMTVLAKAIAKRRGYRFVKALKRNNKTVQVGANEAKRKEQAKTAYVMSEKFKKKVWDDGAYLDKQYLLVDDVWTTGASMEAAIEVLRGVGIKNIAGVVMLIPRKRGIKERR